MGPERLIIDSSSASCHGNMLLFGGSGGLSFGGGGRPVVRMEEIGCISGAKRRPFFTSAEELIFEDEYYDEQMLPEKKRRLTSEQVHMLERSFEAENKLEPEKKSELAKKLGLQPRQVAVWFQNRRARWKTKQLERDFDRLKALYDSLLADHDNLLVNHGSLVADNQRLRSEVVSLTEKLQAKSSPGDQQQQQKPEQILLLNVDTATPVVSFGAVEQKTEDHLSSGSRGSAVVDECPRLMMDSSESYYPEPEDGSYQGGCGYMVHSEEEDGSDDGGGGYLPGVFADTNGVMEHEQQQQPQQVEEEVNIGWWVWS